MRQEAGVNSARLFSLLSFDKFVRNDDKGITKEKHQPTGLKKMANALLKTNDGAPNTFAYNDTFHAFIAELRADAEAGETFEVIHCPGGRVMVAMHFEGEFESYF